MPLYTYDSYNKSGARVKGKIDASTLAAAREALRGQGLMPVNITELRAESTTSPLMMLFEKKVEVKDVVLFTKQLSVLLRSGVPLLQAIELLMDQFEGPLHRILVSVRDGIKSGEPLANELAKYPRVFSNIYVQLVRAGEASGKLEILLERLTTYLQKSEETKKRIAGALRQPMIMLSFSGLLLVGLMTFLVPKMKDMLSKAGQDLPAATKVMLVLSDFMVANYLALIFVFLGIVVGFTYWKNTPQGKYQMDALFLRLPLISYFAKTKAVVEFSKTLGMLLESGVNLSEALDIVCNIIENKILTTRLNEARDKIIKEGKIAKYLKETHIFPPIASYMISTGEQSGKLAEMLTTVGNDYDVELEEITNGLTEAIQPIMLIVMGGMVLIIIGTIFLPIMQMGNAAGI